MEHTEKEMIQVFRRAEAQLADRKKDLWLGVRVVLLLATGISGFFAPWPLTVALGFASVLSLVWPHKD
jgi:hypothetical protein